jgi:hypothetical protein
MLLTTLSFCRRPMEKEHGPLCQSCEASGAGQRVVAELMGEQREQEARFAAAASQVGVNLQFPFSSGLC